MRAMGMTEENERKLQKHHQELCKALNLDKSSANETWKTFKKTFDTYVLEGDPLHWLGCALYVTCKTSTAPSVSRNFVHIQGNLVSLARLLRIIDLSLIDFFLKIRKWVSLQELPADLRESIDKLERIFNVSMVLYKKFQPIFFDMFQNEISDQPKNKSKKLKAQQPNVRKIFEFTWTLFLCLKSNFPNIVDDLVNSYYLLLACCDFIYANSLMSGRKDILVENFSPVQNQNKKYIEPSDVPCILDKLCELHHAKPVEAKSIKEYYWKKHIKMLFDKKLLKGNSELLSEILDVNNFDYNFKSISKVYEAFVLSSGSVDERVFIGYQTNQSNPPDNHNIGEQTDSKRRSNLQNEGNLTQFNLERNGLPTPLKSKSYEHDSESVAVIISSRSGPSLKSLLQSRPSGPSEYLKQLKCISKMEQTISQITTNLFIKLVKEECPNIKEMENITILVKKMFYKLLDSIFSEEIKKPEFVPDVLLNQDIFIKTLFACAFEIISFTMNLNKNFPWILETLDITPFHYYRIIEVVVRNEDALKRDVVKHLNIIEETILESLAWRNDSPLWKTVVDSNLPIPTSEDVIVQTPGSEGNETQENQEVKDKLDTLAGKTIILTNSPGAPLADKFLSPNRQKRSINEVSGIVTSDGEPSSKIITLKSGANIENVNISNTINKVTITTKDDSSQDDKTKKNLKEIKKPKKTGSILLFFRKFYYLASVRLEDMCNQLRITTPELRLKIWTCFEKTIVQNVDLMLDRHLDQMLMCSIYVICKIVGHDLTFMDMMKCYRNQPQAQSHIYRNVLITPNWTLEDLKNGSRREETEEKSSEEGRGDIIKFYNNVYVHKVKEFARKFRTTGDNDRFVLSPIPVKKGTPINGPKRITESLPIYLSGPGKKYVSPNSKPLNYYFARSPAKDLHAINVMVSHEMIPKIGKQLLNDETSNTSSSGVMTRKVKDLFAERMTMKSQENSETFKPFVVKN